MGKLLDTVLDRIFAVLGALIFSQAPAFIQQYTQQLAGSVHELRLQVDQIHQIAKNGDLTIADYMAKFKGSSDTLFQAQGDMLEAILNRYASLSEALTNLEGAGWLARPFVFASHFNSDLFLGTFKHFTPAVNISIEGIVWAFIGLLAGYFLYHGIRQATLEIWKTTRKNEA